MAVNPGLKSRFSEKLHFRDFSAEEACQLLRGQLRRDSLQLAADAEAALPGLMQQVRGWGGGVGGGGELSALTGRCPRPRWPTRKICNYF